MQQRTSALKIKHDPGAPKKPASTPHAAFLTFESFPEGRLNSWADIPDNPHWAVLSGKYDAVFATTLSKELGRGLVYGASGPNHLTHFMGVGLEHGKVKPFKHVTFHLTSFHSESVGVIVSGYFSSGESEDHVGELKYGYQTVSVDFTDECEGVYLAFPGGGYIGLTAVTLV